MGFKITLHNASRNVLGLFFVLAGINHFYNPEFYLPLIPSYFGYPVLLNILSGLLEVVFGMFVLISSFKKYGAVGIILLLLIFIPSHVYFIQIGGCISDGLCVPMWLAWIRLLVIHPLLILWAILVYKN